jgi:hypothetical protein
VLFLGITIVLSLALLTAYAKRRGVEEDVWAERLAMQNRDWLFPERRDV